MIKVKLHKIVCPFLAMLMLVGCAQKPHLSTTTSNHQEIGESVHELYYDEHYMMNIDYPKTNIEKLDEEIQASVQELRSQYVNAVQSYQEEDKAELNISFQSYVKNDRYISIKLDVYQSIYDKKEKIVSICYDRENEQIVQLEDIFDKGIIEEIAKQAKTYFETSFPDECGDTTFAIGIVPMPHNYQTFVMRKDALVVYFQEGALFDKSATFEVKYDDIEEFTSMKQEDVATFVPYDDILNEPVKMIDKGKPMVALTFDDGPTRKYTIAILDALKENQASATFFILGSRANNFPEILQRMVLEGNEIGNHTFSHKQLTTLSKENVEEEIANTQESIHNITNKYPEMIRPPYGSKNDMVLQCTQGKKLVTWSLDTQDWKSRNPEVIVNKVLSEVKDGDIILLHDLYDSTAQAAIILIPKLIEEGYQLVTVSQLYEAGKNAPGKIL